MSHLPREKRAEQMRNSRHSAILKAALDMAEEVGFRRMTRNEIAARAGLANGSINHAFGTMDALRDAVMQEAVRTRRAGIIQQGLADKHPYAQSAPPDVKMLALNII